MKKYAMPAVVILACLTAFSFAPAGGREYVPVVKAPNVETGYIEKVVEKDHKFIVSMDQINWYEGDEATQKFLEREGDAELDGPPDGYYIINDDSTISEFPIAKDAEVLMQIYNRTGNAAEADIVWNEPITVSKFAELMNTEDDLDPKGFPYHVTIKDGEIIRIVQQYVP
ncbi:hypothetical protein FHS15_001891 [Paenibacillus castaneae]|uniref:hypothetical protein n=1 Tax=Paenibacillus castaneae TaxID=474957 RepID=UPI001ABA1905|nr:hypothetical protein [Paenibacillus castaneae]NIK76766.1 hypothetical protein [Paenibacillus castaneae]